LNTGLSRPWILVIPLLLLVAALGARHLNSDGIWYDEWWSLYNAGAPLFGGPLSPAEIWDRLAIENPNWTPGHIYLLAAWGSAVGWTEYAGRALSLLTGLIAVAGMYRLGVMLTGSTRIGLASAALLGTSAFFVFYLHEMRSYMPQVAATVLLLVCYRHILFGKPTWLPYVAFTLIGASLIYSHYLGALVFPVIGVWHLAHGVNRGVDRRWWLVILCMALSFVLFAPWMIVVLQQFRAMSERPRPLAPPDAALYFPGELLYAFSNTGTALFALLALVGLRDKRAIPVGILGGLLLILHLAVLHVLRLNELRYAISVLPFLALSVGFGVRELSRHGVPMIAPLAIWLIGALIVENSLAFNHLLQRFPSLPMREAAGVLAPYLRDDDVLINLLGSDLSPTIQSNVLEHYIGGLPGHWEIVERAFLPSDAAYVQRLREATHNAPMLWTLDAPQWVSTEWALSMHLLDEWGYRQCTTLADQPDMRILGFALTGQDRPDRAVTFPNGVNAWLINAYAGNVPTVFIGFDVPPDVPPDTYSFSVQAVDSSGNVVGQYDAGLPGVGGACRLATLPALPAGNYRIVLVIYEWRTPNIVLGRELLGGFAIP
jgi:hypothetical protein